jgi:hypothetical protein
MTDLSNLAAGLSEARRAMVMALPADESWGRVPSRSVAKRAWWKIIPPIIAHRHCPPSPNEEWCLTDLGLALRAHLQSQDPSL